LAAALDDVFASETECVEAVLTGALRTDFAGFLALPWEVLEEDLGIKILIMQKL
jgi:hypothetical protein